VNGLVRKEWREWGLPGAALLLVLCFAWCGATTAADVLLAPRPEPTMVVLATSILFGLALGYAQLVRERARGTLAYLAHREGGRRALLAGKLAVGVPLALALGMLPPLALLLKESFGPLGAVQQPERAVEHALAGLAALPAYAAGLLIAQITPSGFLTFAQGLLACVGCWLYSMWLPLPVLRMSAWCIPLFVLGELALAAALLALARALFLRSHDRDVVLPVRLQTGAGLFALLLLVYPSWWAFSSSVQLSQHSLFEGYPLVVRYADGRYAQMERGEYESRTRGEGAALTKYTLPDGSVMSESEPAIAYSPWPPVELPAEMRNPFASRDRGRLWAWARWQSLDFGQTAPRGLDLRDRAGRPVCLAAGEPTPGAETRTYLDRETWTVRQFRDLPSARTATNASRQLPWKPRALVLARPDGKSFSPRTVMVLGDMGVPLLVDRADGTLWVLDHGAAETRLAELSLPDGDRLVDLQPESEWYAEGWQGQEPFRAAFVGARGRYVWTTGGFQLAVSPAARPWFPRRCRTEVGEASLTALTVRLRELDLNGHAGPGSAVAFEQRYEPSRPGEIGRVALMRLGLLCGPPVLSAQRLLLDSGEPLLLGLLPSPARMPRDFAGLHLLHALLGAAFGVLTWRNVARRGGSRAERVLWSVLAAGFGVFAVAFLWALAPRPSPATNAPAERAAAEPSAAPLAAT
jgi:hypothetical protein